MQAQSHKLRIIAMSDTHDTHHKINISTLPKGDIFIHSGDFTTNSRKQELNRFKQFLQSLPYKHKIVIAGNHDYILDRNYKQTESINKEQEIKLLKECCTYLQHEMVQIEGLRIFGSPYVPQFYSWGFMYDPKEANKLWDTIPENIDILITHGPPYGILDYTHSKENAGCKALLEKIKIIKPKIHIFGHIHEAYGHQEINGVHYYNASNVNINYRLTNQPWVINIQNKHVN